MFDIPRSIPSHINHGRWHVAHVLDAKNRNTDWENWNREELTRRFIRNIHPCNCFYIPHQEWRLYGGDPRVIGFFIERYRERYARVWDEFWSLAGGGDPPQGDAALRYECRVEPTAPPLSTSAAQQGISNASAVAYRATRLTFKADLIEPLSDDGVIEVSTPDGCFRFTKAEFYAEFSNVVNSESYRVQRNYNYSKLPKKALRFKV